MAKKKVQKVLTNEEIYAEKLYQSLKGIRPDEVMENISPSTYAFTKGEEVRVGNLHDCRVENLHFGGRLIEVSYHDKGEAYGVPFDNQRRLPWLGYWMSVEPKKLAGDTRFSTVPSYLRASYMTSSIQSLLSRTYSRGLLDSPNYQRNYVWSLTDKQKLIGSVFNGFDIGRFVLLEYEHPEWRLELVDGKQRIRALREYYEGRFAYEGKTFFELSNHDKHAFEELPVQFSTMQAKYLKKSDLLWLFLSLNCGGVPQTDEHIAHVREMYKQQLMLEAGGA